MKDNFDIRKFLTENKLTNNSKNLEENRSPFPEDWELDSDQEPPVFDEDEIDEISHSLAGKAADAAWEKRGNEYKDPVTYDKKTNQYSKFSRYQSPELKPYFDKLGVESIGNDTTGTLLRINNPEDPNKPFTVIIGKTHYRIGDGGYDYKHLLSFLDDSQKRILATLIKKIQAELNKGSNEVDLEEAKKKKPSAGLTKKGKNIKISKSIKEEQNGLRFNPKPNKVTGAAPDEDKTPFLPELPDTYILGPKQLEILKNFSPPGPVFISPGARIANGTLYILASIIPDLEGKRGRGGKYNIRDHIKASYGSIPTKTYTDGSTRGKHPNYEGMEVLKALNYAILNLSGKSVQLPGKKGSQTADPNKPDVKPAMLDYKAIPGRVVDGGYEIPAAPKKDKVEEINNLNENKIMVDNFDLKAYISGKRMFTENFEPMDTNDEFPYEDLEHLYGHTEDDEDYESDDEDYEPLERQIKYGVNPETGKGKELYEVEDDELDDEEIDDSKWYKDEDEDEDLEFGTKLDKYELPDEFEWEDSFLEEEIEDDENEEEIDDSEWYKDEEDDEDMEFGSVNLDDLEIPERFGWEDDL